MLKSYYEILEVSQTASKAEIKRQFRKLSKMYHPDLNSSLEAQEIFKQIAHAAQILLDDDKRRAYDDLRGFNKPKEEKQEKKEEHYYPPQNGKDITVNIKIERSEAVLGTYRVVNIAHSELCPKCQGRIFANESKCPICGGLGEITKNRKITVKIPQSVKNGAKLRIKGEGDEGKFGGKNGNLYVVVEVNEDDKLKIVGNTVYSKAYISPYSAILGGDIKIETLWGETTLKIPPLTKSNQSFKLVNVGAKDKLTGKLGDQIVEIIIQTPTRVSDEEYRLYEKLKELNQNKKNAKNFFS